MSDSFETLISLLKPKIIPLLILILFFCIVRADKLRKKHFKNKMLRKMRFINKRDEFEIIFNSVTNKVDYNKVRAEGIRNVFSILIGLLIMFLPLSCMIVYLLNGNKINTTLAIIIFLFFLIWGFIMIINKKTKYTDEFFKSFLSEINFNIQYGDNDKKTQFLELYNKAHFNEIESNREYISDYMEYELEPNTKVQLADLHFLYYHRGGKDSHTEEVFEGIMAVVTREKYIQNEIILSRNTFLKSRNRVKSDNNEFEKLFDIYAKDENIENMILSQDVKENLLELYKKYGIMFEISIKGNDIFIRFFTGGLFENVASGIVFSKKKLYREYVIFTSILEIIEKINEIF